ncbi:MAM and LDL-receptor class A domain-containing protein 1-like [Pomacea canaliculata]|uniref:MAM and LDL-receptor class A domain-containing protein 1-like n=1 Tax=Pomacea canaliculata TaxID=400727 RepID=UPI000D736D51|nr:MAM and LDL-receptor class A domain-containing protein 1-like [Pomacea canaliculata]
MYGIKVNQLNLYLGSPGQLGSRIWTRSGSQGFMWLYAEVEIGAVSSAQLVFEAVHGNDYEGDIALDDINVLNGSCPETPAFCDFEDRYACGFVQDTDDMFDWSLNCGSVPASALCPAGDHTYGTGQGHFMYLQTIPQQTGDEAHMLSKPYNPTYGSCLSFWYYMEGTEVGILYVYMRPEGHSLQTSTQLWSLSEDQGPYWHFATVDIESIERFQLEFVGYVVGSTESSIALDDILVMPTTCLKSADCDFEQGGICSWTQSNRDDFDWLVNSGEMGSLDSGPASDHTTGTQSGEYIYLKTSQSGGAAALVSQIISFNPDFSQYCFTFWYYMPVSPAGTLSVTWVVASAGLDSTIGMYLSGSQGNKWIQGFMDIEEDISAFTMAINGTVGSDSHDVIALDDFRLYHYNCSQVKQMTGVARHFMCNDAANTIVTQEKVCNFIRDCPPPYLDEMNCGDCSFQNGYCQWTKNSSSIWQWMLGSGQSHPGHSAPMYDPNGSPTDSFLYLTRDVGTQSAFSDIYSIVFGPCSSTCQILLFFYISGQASQVRVLLEQGEEKTVLWVTNGQDTDKWMEATVYILRVPTLFRIHIQGYTDPTSPLQSIVAVDDVQFINCNFPAPGNCDNSQSQFHCKSSACIPMAAVCDFTDDCGDGSDEVSCDTYPSRTDFEQSLGIWYNDHSGSDNFDWTRTHGSTSTTGTGPSRDHSRGTSNGYYVYIESSVPRKPSDKAWLVSSNAFNPTLGSTCVLRFYYHMFGANIGSLNVYTRLSLLGDLKQILSLTGNYGDAWMRKDVTFQETESFQIVIEGVIGNGDQGDIGIDDISMTPVCQVSTDPFPTGSPPLPTQPASCSANQFACDGNHCIPQTQVCDFQQQCNDGSDELMCGDCSFENDLCGWRDHSTGQFAWVRKSSNDSAITGGPTSDADGLVGGGQYMLVQPTMGVTKDRARLMSPVFNASGTTCHLSFKYHLFGDSAGSLMILLQKAVDIGTDVGISLWHYTGNAGNTWHLHSVDIGQIDFPFVVTFASLPDPGFGSYDVAIDSIDFEDCHPGQILNSTACYSGFCMNGGHCSVVAGVGPTCICVSNYTGFNCSTPPGLRQSNQQARNDNWKTPVGVTLGLLGVAATLGTAVYFIRRNRRSGLRFLFAFRRWHWTRRGRRGSNITNPIFGDGVVDTDNVMQTAEDSADTASQVPQD